MRFWEEIGEEMGKGRFNHRFHRFHRFGWGRKVCTPNAKRQTPNVER
jgi:hypothetical protein